MSVRETCLTKPEIAKKLDADKERRNGLKRCLSLHVGSRWYRAPEISILEKHYDQASDLWSFGCIIYELLQYIIHNEQTKGFIRNNF
jgi:serine/threonine protein kinase